jgi:hypothetical protein
MTSSGGFSIGLVGLYLMLDFLARVKADITGF